jgi:GxxExxY protein
MELNDITGAVVDAALKVHTALGPGLLEAVYERCLVHELNKKGLRTQSQIPLPVFYDGVLIEGGYRIDILVEDLVIVEVKAVENTLPVHCAQLLSYLKLSGKPVGLLINFNKAHLREGIRRISNSRAAMQKDSASSASSASEPRA